MEISFLSGSDRCAHAVRASQLRGARASKMERAGPSKGVQSGCGVTIRRVETLEGEIPVTSANEMAIRNALEAAGVAGAPQAALASA